MKNIIESATELEILAEADVVVCGGGPAGIAAAIASARKGARTILLEATENLGGVWTSGLMPYILGYCEQKGIISEIKEAFQAVTEDNAKNLPLPEDVKLIVEQMCIKEGVTNSKNRTK